MLGAALLSFLLLSVVSCREDLPLGGSNGIDIPKIRFTPGDYYSFDNWKLDFYGSRIPSSYFRSSWTVADTGVLILGRNRVSIIIDSTFDATRQLTRLDSLFFRVDENGDVFQFGFLSSLIAERESLSIAPQWDRIAAFSLPRGVSWVMARIDTSMGAQINQIVSARILPLLEYVGPVAIGTEERAVLSYRIEITKPRLDYILWLSDAPTSFPKAIDDSSILRNTTLRELKLFRSPRQ